MHGHPSLLNRCRDESRESMMTGKAVAETVDQDTERWTAKKSDVTRARILDAAAYVFRRRGYALARLSDIARRAGVRTSNIYYYFDSREEIVSEVLRVANERTRESVASAIAALPTEADASQRLVAAIHGQFRVALADDDYTCAHMRIFDQIPDRLKQHFRRVLDEHNRVWHELLIDAKAEGAVDEGFNVSVLRLLMLGMINWSIEWYRPGRLTIDEVADQAARLVFNGIGPARARS